MKLLEKCLGMLYPQTCCFCGEISREPICNTCKKEVVYLTEPRCKKCGKPITAEEKEYCFDCNQRQTAFEQGKNLWLHQGKVKWSIYQFKYHNRRIYGKFYAREMYRLYGNWIRKSEIDLIIPVPLHKKRRRKRGYNQAEIIAKELGKLTGIPVDTTSLIRKKYTNPQKELNHNDRKKNLKDAFEMRKHWTDFKHILVIDDIYTTGNTINEIAKAIKKDENLKVWFLTISIGQGF